MFDKKSQHFYSITSSPIPPNGNSNHLEIQNLSARVKLAVQNYENYKRVNDTDILFRSQNIDVESDVCSPPLWKSTTTSDNGMLSPNSRTRVIAKAQRELMEIARSMPESHYELSLKDIVDKPIVDSPKSDDETRCLVEGKNIERKKSVKKFIRQESNKVEKRVERVKSDNFENRGLFLKMVFPISIRSNPKKNLCISTNSKRVSPKVETLGKSLSWEKDFSRKRFSGSSGSESGEKIERKKGVNKIIRQESKKIKKRVERVKSDNFENGGLFLKMVFPISIRSNRKKNLCISTNSKRISPKVETLGKSSSWEKDSSRKRFSGSSGSESGESSVTSTSSVGKKKTSNIDNHRIKRNYIKVSTGCWSFAPWTKNKRKSK